MYEMLRSLGAGGFGCVYEMRYKHSKEDIHYAIKKCQLNEVHVLSDEYKQSIAKHTADVALYMAPEGQTTEYNHLIDVYSLALIGAKIFGFDSNNIRDGVELWKD
ncbi:unnamed protein product, partial [Medioppia subpectinata]